MWSKIEMMTGGIMIPNAVLEYLIIIPRSAVRFMWESILTHPATQCDNKLLTWLTLFTNKPLKRHQPDINPQGNPLPNTSENPSFPPLLLVLR